MRASNISLESRNNEKNRKHLFSKITRKEEIKHRLLRIEEARNNRFCFAIEKGIANRMKGSAIPFLSGESNPHFL